MTISSNPLSSALAVAAVKFLSSVRYALGTMSYALNLAGRLGSCCSRSGEISIFSNDMAPNYIGFGSCTLAMWQLN